VLREQFKPEQVGICPRDSDRSIEAATLVHSRGIVGREPCDPHSALAEAQGSARATTASKMAGASRLDGGLPEARVFIPPRSLLG
jgi:hypothetical protein